MRESRSGNFPTLARVALEAAIRDDVDLAELLPEPKPSPSKLMALASWVTEVRKFRYLAGRLARRG